MKHLILTISLILGATAVSADEKVWAFNITDIRLPMKVADYIINTPTSGGYFFIVYKDIEECRSNLQDYVLSSTTSSQVKLDVNNTLDPVNPSAALYNISTGLLQFVECSPKILQD